VYISHLIALRQYEDTGRALRSQIPMLVLMILYTVSSLWIISQPLILEENTAPSQEDALSEPAPPENLREPPMPNPR